MTGRRAPVFQVEWILPVCMDVGDRATPDLVIAPCTSAPVLSLDA
jgi:hypothetical protein